MNIKKLELLPKCFVPQPTEKKSIVIHGSNTRSEYTPLAGKKGSSTDVIARWNANKEKFACAYLIERDGTIVEAFDSNNWSYHLNINNSHGTYDKMSVGIELINEGPLTKDGKDYFINSYIHHQNIYKGPILSKKFRNYDYYADVSKSQSQSLVDLIKWLSAKHDIFPVFHNDFNFDRKVWDKASIFTHSVVNDKVTDIPLNDLLRGVLSTEFPTLT